MINTEWESTVPGGPEAATFFGALGGPLQASLLSCPAIAATVTIVAFLASIGSHDKGLLPGPWSIAIGFGVAVGALTILLRIYRRWYQSAEDVYLAEQSDLQARLDEATSLFPPTAGGISDGRIGQIRRSVAQVRTELAKRGQQWLAGYGYLEIWKKVHRLEEQLYFVAPLTWVSAAADDDKMRFKGSQIPQSDDSRARIHDDLVKLTSGSDLTARADLSAVRRDLNRYRENQWDKLVRDRNMILLAGGMAAIAGWLAAIFMVAQNLQKGVVADAASLVLVGVLISLIHQVVVGLQAADVEDFGQAKARLLVATLVAGLFAPLGAIILGMGFAGAFPATVKFQSWQQWLNWSNTPANIILAAIAAFAPSQVFAILQAQIDKTKAGITGTTSTGSAK